MKFDFDARASNSPYVEMVWRTQSEREGMFTSQAVSHWEMVFATFGGKAHITVRGPETKATTAYCPEDGEFFGIQFKLGTFMPTMPLSGLVDGSVDLPTLTNRSFWLNGAAWQVPDYDNADTFVDRLVRHGLLAHDPAVNAIIKGQQPALSVRSMQYRFLRATGLTHSAVRQIERARFAADLIQRGVAIHDTMFEAEYFDQSHMTRSLKRLIGQTPGQIARAT